MAKQLKVYRTIVFSACLTMGVSPAISWAADTSVDDEVLIIEDEAKTDEPDVLVIEETEPTELLLIEDDDKKQPELEGREEQITIEEPADTQADVVALGDGAEQEPQFTLRLNELWAEYGVFPEGNANAHGLGYLHGRGTARWSPSRQWDLQASVRVDGYKQHGNQDWDLVDLDYDETFVRYRSDSYRITAGAQKILWGRIDEFPPTDRMSTHDLSRYILDDLSDRRRASAAIRYEYFSGNKKWDFVFLPHFREAELPGSESVWFPVNRRSGEILGLNSTPATRALVQASPVDYKASDSDGGFGVRYSGTGEGMDYAVTLQKVRQSLPYFNYNTSRGVLEARYPRSWIVGGDVGVEAAGAIWRIEAGWQSDAPVTHLSGVFDTVESISWGAGVEFFPGDGDARVNLQVTGINHIDAPAVLDRTEIYLLGGSFEMPFAQDRWRVKGRLYKGLDKHDLYLNPEIAYTGIDSQEIYLDAHYFEGAAGTPGGYHQDHSILTLGWRAKF
jgi:hypothetical protein